MDLEAAKNIDMRLRLIRMQSLVVSMIRTAMKGAPDLSDEDILALMASPNAKSSNLPNYGSVANANGGFMSMPVTSPGADQGSVNPRANMVGVSDGASDANEQQADPNNFETPEEKQERSDKATRAAKKVQGRQQTLVAEAGQLLTEARQSGNTDALQQVFRKLEMAELMGVLLDASGEGADATAMADMQRVRQDAQAYIAEPTRQSGGLGQAMKSWFDNLFAPAA
jgi:hypothetical protein